MLIYAAVRNNPQSVRSPFFATLLGSLIIAAIHFPTAAFSSDRPMVSLAIGRVDQLAYQRPSTGSEAFTLSLSQPLFGARAKFTQGDAAVLATQPSMEMELGSCLEKRREASREFLTTRKNLREYGQSRMWATFQAGYGQLICDEPGMIFKSYDGWQEPGCGYFKVSFSF